MYVSSTHHRSPVACRQGRAASANSGVNRCTQRNTLTWSTSMPRSASISSRSRYDSPYRRYQRTASVITSGGNRKPAKADLSWTQPCRRRRIRPACPTTRRRTISQRNTARRGPAATPPVISGDQQRRPRKVTSQVGGGTSEAVIQHPLLPMTVHPGRLPGRRLRARVGARLLPAPALGRTAVHRVSPGRCGFVGSPLRSRTIDKDLLYVKTDFRHERRRVLGPDRAGGGPAQAAADRSAAAARRAPVVHRGGGRARPDPAAGLLPREAPAGGRSGPSGGRAPGARDPRGDLPSGRPVLLAVPELGGPDRAAPDPRPAQPGLPGRPDGGRAGGRRRARPHPAGPAVDRRVRRDPGAPGAAQGVPRRVAADAAG